jgi:hypothetical protein
MGLLVCKIFSCFVIGFLYNFTIKQVLVYLLLYLLKKRCVKRESQKTEKTHKNRMGWVVIRGGIHARAHTHS